jgi:hypothetical protein
MGKRDSGSGAHISSKGKAKLCGEEIVRHVGSLLKKEVANEHEDNYSNSG